MKKPLLLFMLLLAITSSCKKEESPVPAAREKGRLKIEIGLFIHVSAVNNPLKSTRAVEDFRVEICLSGGTVVQAYEKASDMPASVELDPGTYFVAAHSNNRLPAAFDNPYFYGRSGNFTVAANTEQTVLVNCELANTMITVVWSDNVKNNFTGYYTVVKAGADSLVFSAAETRAGYFEPASLSVVARLTYDKGGSVAEKVLSGSIANAQARRHYEIRVDALPDNNSSSIRIILDESVDSTQVIALREGGEVPEGDIPAGGLIITEIMANPAAMADNAGEWLEVYNTLPYAVSLHNLVIRRDAADSHVITGSVELGPGRYFVLARTDSAVNTASYVYGSSLSLTNSTATLSISNYGTNGSDGSVIFSVTYGGTGFAVPNGASLSLNPLHLNAADAQSGTWWCTASTPYGRGDLGTPGMGNDPCN